VNWEQKRELKWEGKLERKAANTICGHRHRKLRYVGGTWDPTLGVLKGQGHEIIIGLMWYGWIGLS
jgi:hypothetical protein